MNNDIIASACLASGAAGFVIAIVVNKMLPAYTPPSVSIPSCWSASNPSYYSGTITATTTGVVEPKANRPKKKRTPPARRSAVSKPTSLAEIKPGVRFVLVHTDGTRTRFIANSIAVDGSIAATFADGALEGQKCEVIPGPGMRLEVEVSMKYLDLKQGDVRQAGDEYRFAGYPEAEWSPVSPSLIGTAICAGYAETNKYRRPIPDAAPSTPSAPQFWCVMEQGDVLTTQETYFKKFTSYEEAVKCAELQARMQQSPDGFVILTSVEVFKADINITRTKTP